MKEFDHQDLAELLSAERVIGKGSHGWVYRATVRMDGRDRDVAIKKSSVRDTTKLHNEAKVLWWLRRNHNVINLIGTSTQSNVMVMELMPNGSLHELLHSPAATPPPWAKRVHMAMQIAKAVRSLHAGEPPVVHRDIKPANILFDAEWNIKLADFGLAMILKPGGERDWGAAAAAGTIGYMDPRYTAPEQLTTQVDVFSFGVVLLEMFSSGKAIDVLRSPSDIVEWAVPEIERGRWAEVCDARLPVPDYVVMQMLRIAVRCVSSSSGRPRPTMAQVVQQMEACSTVPRWWRWTSAFSQPRKQFLTLRDQLLASA